MLKGILYNENHPKNIPLYKRHDNRTSDQYSYHRSGEMESVTWLSVDGGSLSLVRK